MHSSRKIPNAKRAAIGSRAVMAATTIAIVLTALLIILGRVSSHTSAYSQPPPTSGSPIVGPSPSQPPPTPTPTSTPPPTVLAHVNSKGSLNAPVTIIEYSDFQCSHCQQFALTIAKQLDTTYIETGKVRLIYKHLIAFGQESLLAAEASECAAEQGQFWPYYELLMQLRASPDVDDLPISRLESLASQLGLDMATFRASLESEKYRGKVLQDDADGRALGIKGVPAFFINGVKMEGVASFEALQNVIEDALKRAAG